MHQTNFRRFIVLMGLALTLLMGSFTAPALAQGKQLEAPVEVTSFEPQIIEPNEFALQGKDITINYSTTSFTGKPQFNYKTQNQSRQFTGSEISTLETGIGVLVTVLVEADADTGKEVRLTLLLPAINLPSNSQTPISTEAILTTQRTPQRGSSPILNGQLQTYETLPLTGTAALVDFLTPNS